LTTAQEELVSSACNDCERLLKTLASILDLARLESGASQLNLHEEPARSVLEENYSAFRDKAEAASRPLRVESEDPLPRVAVDSERLSLVFSNLLTNALKYGYAGSEIILRARPIDSAFVRFSVVNSGLGINDQELPRVFDKFYRSSGHKGDGVGLGLSIARQIVLAHGGRIGVLSEPGKLTEFYFDLPGTS
jgi:NtrC-family two-component system sensor histidine kinase KinB